MVKNKKTNPIELQEQTLIKYNLFSYQSEKKWLLFPNWARFYLHLGTALSCYQEDGSKFVLAISIPNRLFAASLIATGLIIPRIELVCDSLQLHINQIQSLPLGSSVVFRDGKKQYKGRFEGKVLRGERYYFCIKYEKGSEKYFPLEDSLQIDILENQVGNLPTHQGGRQLDSPSELLTHFFEAGTLQKLLTESKLECVIIGRQKLLQQELCDFPFGYKYSEKDLAIGKIVDFVRVKGAQFQPPNLSFRSYVLPASNKYNQQFASKLNNYFTIFDSSLGYIKWRNLYGNSNWIVVLDKTDHNYEIALKEINGEFIQNRIDKRFNLPLPNPPAGIELMVFEVN